MIGLCRTPGEVGTGSSPAIAPVSRRRRRVSEPGHGSSPGPPRAVDRGGYRHGGGVSLFPPAVLRFVPRTPPGLPAGDTHMRSPTPPPRPRFALLPRPRVGAGAVMAISGESRARERCRRRLPGRIAKGEPPRSWFSPGISPGSGPWWLSPWGRGLPLPAGGTPPPCPGLPGHRETGPEAADAAR